MKILVVGGGGREHALAWHFSGRGGRGGAQPSTGGERPAGGGGHTVVVTPGNAGIARAFRCVPSRIGSLGAAGVEDVVRVAREERVDLVVVGPEQPLVDGVVDALAAAGIPAFGPTQSAARLEGSKAFMKDVAKSAGARTADFAAGTRVDDVRAFVESRIAQGRGVVVKADGLAAGKGVVVLGPSLRPSPEGEGLSAADAMAVVADFLGGRFGDAGRTVVVEDLLPGDELSVFALCDGEGCALFSPARDHKRLLDGDRGPNTGGMGAIAPVPVDDALLDDVKARIVLPVLAEMKKRGAPFRGVLFCGLMLVRAGAGTASDARDTHRAGAANATVPWLLEFNVRFGDPETEALLVATDVDLAPHLLAVARGERLPPNLDLRARGTGAVVVMAAHGYPDAPRKGDPIRGLDDAARVDGAVPFCAGVAEKDGALVASGGRVLAVAARGAHIDEALARAYAAVDRISFAGAQARRDIGRSLTGAKS